MSNLTPRPLFGLYDDVTGALTSIVDSTGKAAAAGALTVPEVLDTRATGAILSNPRLLNGNISGNRITSVPLATSTDDVTYALGPTGGTGTATTEYATLISGKHEIAFTSGGAIANATLLKKFTRGLAFPLIFNSNSIQLRSAPRPTTSLNDWWSRGEVAFYADGAGTVTISYMPYAAVTGNSAYVMVDGKRITGSATDGKLSDSVAGTGANRQWVTLTFTSDKRRLIRVSGVNFYLCSIVHSWGVTLSQPDYAGKALLFGDSFAARVIATGETATTLGTNGQMGQNALELLGYDVVNATTGGTGFVYNGGGAASGKGSYSDYMSYYQSIGIPLGFAPADYSLVCLWGSGNDNGYAASAADYLSRITQALSLFPNAKVGVTSVYEGFNTAAVALALNTMLVTAVRSAQSMYPGRVLWCPVDSVYKWDSVGVWSGSGSVPNPAFDGNADVYFSNAAQGSSDRHPNTTGVCYGSKFYAAELIRAGVPFVPA